MEKISIIASVYNEEKNIIPFYDSIITSTQNIPTELIFVNDGSTDDSLSIITSLQDSEFIKIKVCNLLRNYGHEKAMLAGLNYTTSDCIIFIDTDMQHPASLIPEIYAKRNSGNEIVLTKKTDNLGAGFFSKLLSGLFYRTLNLFSSGTHFTSGASDYFCISENVKKIVQENQSNILYFLRGYIQSLKLNAAIIEYKAAARLHGKSHYSFINLFKLGYNAIFLYSDKPLKLSYIISGLIFLSTLPLIAYSLYQYITTTVPSGYTTIVILICVLFGCNFLILGIICKYLSFIFKRQNTPSIYSEDLTRKNKV